MGNTNARNGFLLLSKYRGAVMGIAAIWILIYHEYIRLTPDGAFAALEFAERFIKRIGFCGVDIFFLLSGIGLTFAIKKKKLPRFYYRRIRRVALPFLAIAAVRAVTEQWDLSFFIKNVTGCHFYTRSIYSLLWFVPAIVTFYLLFPLYYRLFDDAENKTLFTAGAIMLWLLVTLILRERQRNDLFGFTNRVPVFLIGVLFGWLTQNRKELVFTKRTYLFLLIAFLLGLYLAYLANFKNYELLVPVGNCCLPNCLIAVSLPLLLAKAFDFCARRIPRIEKAAVGFFAFFGVISLEFYCVQEWFSDLMIPKLRNAGLPDALINLAIFAMVTAIAWAASKVFGYFWQLVELPFAKKKKAAAES